MFVFPCGSFNGLIPTSPRLVLKQRSYQIILSNYDLKPGWNSSRWCAITGPRLHGLLPVTPWLPSGGQCGSKEHSSEFILTSKKNTNQFLRAVLSSNFPPPVHRSGPAATDTGADNRESGAKTSVRESANYSCGNVESNRLGSSDPGPFLSLSDTMPLSVPSGTWRGVSPVWGQTQPLQQSSEGDGNLPVFKRSHLEGRNLFQVTSYHQRLRCPANALVFPTKPVRLQMSAAENFWLHNTLIYALFMRGPPCERGFRFASCTLYRFLVCSHPAHAEQKRANLFQESGCQSLISVNCKSWTSDLWPPYHDDLSSTPKPISNMICPLPVTVD